MCPWALVRSCPLFTLSLLLSFSLCLSLSLSFFSSPSFCLGCPGVPGCFRHCWEPFPLFGVSLDACVVAGSASVSSFLSFSSLPPLFLLFSRAWHTYKQTRLLQQVSQRGLVCHWFAPFHLVPLSLAPTDVFPPFLSCLSVFMSLHPHPFLSLARAFVRTLACTHTRTRILLTTRFRWPRFVTMRFGSSVVPLHLVLLHRQPHTLFVCLVVLIFICLLCAHVCVTLGLTGNLSVLCRRARPVTSYLAQRSWDVTGEASRDALMCTCMLVFYL